jgi:hypothetical protein
MKCVCPLAGYCNTHQRKMTPAMHGLCRSSDAYFDAFQVDLAKGRNKPSKASRSPSDVIPRPTGCSGCQKRKAVLNAIRPGLGDAVEVVTTATGIKDWWENSKSNS